MKKFLISILSAMLIVASCLMVACGKSSSFSAPGFTDFGAVKSQNGFVAQTENYVLFINGVATSTDDNTYGTPVKGSLMAIKNADFVAGKFNEAKIIVPKLFAATDYTSGIYVKGDYVYYGTPSTDRNSSGSIANGTIVFMKSKIDGTEKPTKLFDYSSLSVSYRIADDGESVYIVYYDSDDAALKVYSEKTGETVVIAKTDATTNEETNKVYLSLGEYKFMETTDSFSVIYTATVYDQKYYEKEAEQTDYSRSTATYNYVYTYKAGDTKKDGEAFIGTRVLDGSEKELTYALKLAQDGFVFYTETDVNSNATTKGCATTDIADITKHQEIKNTDLVADTTYIVSLSEIYVLNSGDDGDNTVYTTSLVSNERAERKTVILANSALSSILFKNGNDLYFYNNDNAIVRVEISNKDAKTVRVSLGATNTSWFAPQIITVDGKEYMLYCDSTTVGSSYTYVADLSSEITEEDTDDDDEIDLYYLSSVKFMGQMTDVDSANVVADACGKIDSTLELVEKDGVLVCEEYDNAQKIYDDLSDSVKECVAEDYTTKLANCKKAVELANKYNKLAKVREYDSLTDDEKATLKTAYEEAKSARDALIKEDSTTYETIRDMIPENIKYFYQQCVSKIDG